MGEKIVEQFSEAAKRVGTEVHRVDSLEDAAEYIKQRLDGRTLVPETELAKRYRLRALLSDKGVDVFAGNFREAGQVVAGGVTFSNFGMADSGTVVLESTDEDIRLATTLPDKHFIVVDPKTILADNLAAAPYMNRIHEGYEPKFVAYITGPSRTADIERVLTIGCHGPRELHILLLDNISSDFLEN